MNFYIVVLVSCFSLLLASCFPPGSEDSGSSPLGMAIPFILIFVLFYFLILRPQHKQSKKRDLMLESLKRGDRIVTSGGIYGRIINIDGDMVTLEIAKGINIQISKASISDKVEAEPKQKGGKQ